MSRQSITNIMFGLALALLLGGAVIQASETRPSQVPLEITYAVEPNILFLIDTSDSMNKSASTGTHTGPPPSRLAVAQNAVNQIIEQTDHTRFCLASFTKSATNDDFGPPYGAAMSGNSMCESENKTAIQSAVSALTGSGYTPLASSYYDVTRYFRGKGPAFGVFDGINNQHPIQYRCQTNNVIIVSGSDPDHDWEIDEVVDTTIDFASEAATIPISEGGDGQAHSFIVGDANSGNWDNLGPTDEHLIDDLALFARQIDLVPESTNGHNYPAAAHYTANNLDDDGEGFDDSDFKQQNLITHTIGYGINLASLQAAAINGGGTFQTIDTEFDSLVGAISLAVSTSIGHSSTTNAGAAQTSVELVETGVGEATKKATHVFVTEYDSSDWSGDLHRIEFEQDNNGGFTPVLKWSAAAKLDSRDITRRIFTHDGASTNNIVDFNYTALTASNIPALGGNTENEEALINYIRGDRSKEQIATSPTDRLFRTRSSILGDLIHSRPKRVKRFNYGYPDEDYKAFLKSEEIKNRAERIYVGGNDGMLHAFDEEGNEKFAFIPHTLLPHLQHLSTLSYNDNHQYYLDGEMTIVDAKIDYSSAATDGWGTALVSPLGAGYKGLFALDVSNPSASDSQTFMWEINETTSGYSEMGHIINIPKIARFKVPTNNNGDYKEQWAAIVGNGVHSQDANINNRIGQAVLYIIDLKNGSQLAEIVIDDALSGTSDSYTSFSEGNGLTSVEAIDIDFDGYVDRIYAGDLKGNIWRFNYNETGATASTAASYITANLTPAFGSGVNTPIFTATGPVRAANTNGTSNVTSEFRHQAITGELTVTPAPKAAKSSKGEMIFFGTGQYFDFSHLLAENNRAIQTMYAFWDKGGWGTSSDSATRTRANLKEQIINQTANGTTRHFTNAPPAYDQGELGWYMDLPDYGERIIRKPISVFDHIAFASQGPPSADRCVDGVQSWNMIARKDTATALIDDQGTLIDGGTKNTGKPTQDPIFIESSSGELIGLQLDSDIATGNAPASTFKIPKDYQRTSWKKISP